MITDITLQNHTIFLRESPGVKLRLCKHVSNAEVKKLLRGACRRQGIHVDRAATNSVSLTSRSTLIDRAMLSMADRFTPFSETHETGSSRRLRMEA